MLMNMQISQSGKTFKETKKKKIKKIKDDIFGNKSYLFHNTRATDFCQNDESEQFVRFSITD